MEKTLKYYRDKILSTDKEIFILLGQRAKLAEQIGLIKAKNHLNVEDLTQEKRVVQRNLEFAHKAGLEEGFSKKIIEEMIRYSKLLQEKELSPKKLPQGS